MSHVFVSSADCCLILLFWEHNKSAKQLRSGSGPTLCRSLSGSKLFAKVRTAEVAANKERVEHVLNIFEGGDNDAKIKIVFG